MTSDLTLAIETLRDLAGECANYKYSTPTTLRMGLKADFVADVLDGQRARFPATWDLCATCPINDERIQRLDVDVRISFCTTHCEDMNDACICLNPDYQ